MSKRLISLLLISLIGFALWYAVRDIAWPDLQAVLGQLSWVQIVILLVLNAGILLLFGARWWLILRAQGYPILYLLVAAYRLAGFSISYFTPGPHFGGEPAQVELLRIHHRVPGSVAVASVGLDKILEMSANFSFLVLGCVTLLLNGVLAGRATLLVFGVSVGLLALPLLYFLSLARGRNWLSNLGQRIPARLQQIGWLERVLRVLKLAEIEIGGFQKKYPAVFWRAILVSAVVWVVLVFEYGLAIRFLGLSLNIWQVIGVMTAARIAILLPMPGGLGVLEASQVFMMELLGMPPALGIGISLLIRARDILFGLLGLWLGRKFLTGAFYASGSSA